jgi:hypothetical protein
MPETNVVKGIVLRRKKLTDEEWLALLDDRRERMNPIMDRLTLTKLESVVFNKDKGGSPIRLSDWSRDLQIERGVLDLQGIFVTEGANTNAREADFTIWGLLRHGVWFACEFREVWVASRYELKNFRARELHAAELHKECDIRYHQMLCLLSTTVHEFANRRREQLRELEQLEQQFEHENVLIEALSV